MNFINQFIKLLLRVVITAQQQQRLLELEQSLDINYDGYNQDFDEDKIEEILAEYGYDINDIINGYVDEIELEEIFNDYFLKNKISHIIEKLNNSSDILDEYDEDIDKDKIEEILAEYNYDFDDVLNGYVDDTELEEIFEDYFQKNKILSIAERCDDSSDVEDILGEYDYDIDELKELFDKYEADIDIDVKEKVDRYDENVQELIHGVYNDIEDETALKNEVESYGYNMDNLKEILKDYGYNIKDILEDNIDYSTLEDIFYELEEY